MLRRNADYTNLRPTKDQPIKGPTSFLKLPPVYDVFRALTVDPMHAISLGVMKYFLKHVWLCPKLPSEHVVDDSENSDEDEEVHASLNRRQRKVKLINIIL